MAKDRKKVIHIHSNVPNKLPNPEFLEVGEIAINNAKDNEFISFKNTEDEAIRFSSDLQLVDWMEKKEVVPTGGTVTTELDDNISNFKIDLNQTVSKNTSGATELNLNSGFTITTDKLAVIGGNPTFSSLTVNNETTLKGKTNISGETRIDNNLTVTGGTNISGNTKIASGLNVTGATTISGDTTITGTTNITGDTNINGTTKITGNTTVNGDLTVTGDTNISGNTRIDKNITVSGNTFISGNTTIDKNLTVNGDTKLQKLSATTANVTNLYATSNISGSSLTATTISGTNAYIKNITADTENVTSLTATSGNVTNLSANTISGGSAVIGGTLNVSGNTTIDKNLTVNGDTQLNGKLNVDGEAEFASKVVFDDEVEFEKPIKFSSACESITSSTIGDAICEAFDRSVITIEKDTNPSGTSLATVYTVKQNGETINTIEVAKDKVLKSAETVKVNNEWYIRLTWITFDPDTQTEAETTTDVSVASLVKDIDDKNPNGLTKETTYNNVVVDVWYEGGQNWVSANTTSNIHASGNLSADGNLTVSEDTVLGGKLNVSGNTTLKNVTATTISATTHVKSPLVSATTINGVSGNITNLTATSFSATNGNITNLTANTISGTNANITNITASTENVTNLTATSISASTIVTPSGLSKALTWALGTPSADNTGYNGSTDKSITIPSSLSHITSAHTHTSSEITGIGNGTFTVSGDGTAVASTSANTSTNGGVNIVPGNNVTISANASTHTIKISSNYSDTKVTAVGNHYTPSSSTTKTASASGGGSLAWGGSVMSGVTVYVDAAGHMTNIGVSSAKLPSNPNTDSATTYNGHYTPSAAAGGTKSASASGGGSLIGGSSVVTGVTLSGDAKGHVTAVVVSSAKLPNYTGGRAIDVTNNTISLDLPISAGTGTDSIIEGSSTTASGNYSHAEGYKTKANGLNSHAEGASTIASGISSHAEGCQTKAYGDYSHADGYYTTAYNQGEHACGTHNVSRTGSTDAAITLFTVGNGSDSPESYSNAFEIRKNGDVYITNGGASVKLQDSLSDSATTYNGHYTPSAAAGGTKSASASGGNSLSWGSSVITGVTLSGDAKGHVTAVAVSSAKLPSDPTTGLSSLYLPLSGGTATGNITAPAFYASSDVNLKHDINDINTEEIEKINSVQLKSFKFNNDETDRKVYGVIAQEVQNADLNELVHTADDGMLSVDYTSLLILKIASLEDYCKKLNDRISELENKQ